MRVFVCVVVWFVFASSPDDPRTHTGDEDEHHDARVPHPHPPAGAKPAGTVPRRIPGAWPARGTSTEPPHSVMSEDTVNPDEAFVGWPSLAVARVFRVDYGHQLTRLFKLYVGQRPSTQKVKSFDDLEKMKSLMTVPEFIKLLGDWQLYPQWLNKTDLGYIHSTGTAGIPVPMEAKSALMAYDEFLKCLWYTSRELTKKEFAPWLENVDNFDDMPEVARQFIEYLKETSATTEIVELASLWRRTKPKPFVPGVPSAGASPPKKRAAKKKKEAPVALPTPMAAGTKKRAPIATAV